MVFSYCASADRGLHHSLYLFNMKNQKISKVTTLANRRRLLGVPFAAKPSSGSHRIIETSDLHKSKYARLSGHPHKPELAGLIEKALQEADVLGREGTQHSEEDLSCLKEIKKKVCENKKDKDGGHERDASVQLDTSEKKKDLSSFVEIDLRDRVEEKTEDILTEDKQHEKEEESPDTVYDTF
ncbi:hypothetical protein JD844_032175 [Phrynosoma platyrhinos]|uniref:Uncharacterized protein n=1 Tax=Phrynosoma platyrhinos TaxID=52577 RepID=A0ABQ7T4J2_PHRPL|nr:hypothetical protein JD844_032175 [Phrynosoma platyrhinos]